MNRKIKVAFVLDKIDYQMGGTEKQILMILENMDPSMFEIHLCCFRNSRWINDNSDRFRIFFFDFSSFKKPKSYYEFCKFVKYLKHNQFDILVSFFPDSNKIAVPAARLSGVKKVVLSRRNLNHWVTKNEILILKLLRPFVNSYWVNAEAIKTKIAAQENIDLEKIEVIYNGFDLREFSQTKTLPLLETIPQSKIVVNVSNLREVKGLDVFIKAASLVISECSDVHFLVIGEGEKRSNLERLIKDLGVGTHVSLIGSRTDVNLILAGSDIGVLSSHSEGLSNAIIEYMAAGLPVVCTDVGGASEMVADNENGYLVPPAAAELMGRRILELLNNDALRHSFGGTSRKKALDMFQCQTMIARLSDYLQGMVGLPSSSD